MKSLISSLACCLFIAIITSGCTHSRQFTSYQKITEEAVGKKAVISFYRGEDIKCSNLNIQQDSTYIFNMRSKTNEQIETAAIKKITVINRVRGAREGFIPFLIGGGVLGVASLFGDSGFFSKEELAAGFVIGGVIYGAAIGVPIGLIAGSKEVYVLPHDLNEIRFK